MRNAFSCLLSCRKPLSWERMRSLAVTESQSSLALCVELGLIYCSVWSPKQNQNSRTDRYAVKHVAAFPAILSPGTGSNCFKGYLVSSVQELYLKEELNRHIGLLEPQTWNCWLRKWKMRETTLLSPCPEERFGFWLISNRVCEAGMAVTWGHASVKEIGWAKGTGLLLFLCLHSKSRGCLDVEQSGALLVQSEQSKERWKMEGWKEEKQKREGGEARREEGSVFSGDTGVIFIGINTGSLNQSKST